MREILFRGKRCDNGEWAQGYYIRAEHHWHNHGIHKDWITLGASANGGWFALHNKYAVKAETVGQFTGLTDKNGKKVFEGDILKFTDAHAEYEWIGKVEFGNPNAEYNWGFQLVYISGTKPNTDILLWFDMEETGAYSEVIGNIHDNPELLENP